MLGMNGVIDRTHAFLKKLFKTDITYIATGGFWVGLNQFSMILFAFLLSLIMGRYIPKDVYGYYKYIFSLSSIVGSFTLSGINTALSRSVARGMDGVLRSAFWVNMKWSILPSTIALVGAGYYFINGDILLGSSLILVCVLLPITDSTGLYGPFLAGKKNFKLDALFAFLRNGLFCASLAATVFIHPTPFTLVFVNLFVNALISTILYVIVLKKYKVPYSVDSEAMVYAKHLSVINIVNDVASRIESVLIFHFIGPVMLATYSFANAIPLQMKNVYRSISILLLPKFSNRTPQEIKRGLLAKTLWFGLLLFLGMILYIILAPYVFKYLFPQYTDAVLYSQVLALMLVAGITQLPTTGLFAHSAIKELYKTNVYSSLALILGLVIGVYWFGVWGAIFVRVIFKYIDAILAYYYFGKFADNYQAPTV
jgi:O-antigen/teichoic acid export membrane protein